MSVLLRQRWTPLTAGLVPLLMLASPAPLQLAGVPPSWAALWLLPWALVDGPFSGVLAGVVLGLLLDALHAGPVSEIPALALLGWWWGRLGRRSSPIERSFSLGLLALLGAALQGVLIWLQQLCWGETNVAALHTLLAQTLITAVLAPALCSLQLLFWRQLGPAVGADPISRMRWTRSR
jgi:rod shape-determining protein MreD